MAGDNETLVYTSALAGGPKLQIAYKQGGNYVYPPTGMVARPFKVGERSTVLLGRCVLQRSNCCGVPGIVIHSTGRDS